MEQPTPNPQTSTPPSPVPDWQDLPDPQRRELLAVLTSMLLDQHRRREKDDERQP